MEAFWIEDTISNNSAGIEQLLGSITGLVKQEGFINKHRKGRVKETVFNPSHNISLVHVYGRLEAVKPQDFTPHCSFGPRTQARLLV